MNLRMKKFFRKVLLLFTACTFYRERKEPAPPKPESKSSISSSTADEVQLPSHTPDITSSTPASTPDTPCLDTSSTPPTCNTPDISSTPTSNLQETNSTSTPSTQDTDSTQSAPELTYTPASDSAPGCSGISRCVFKFEHPKLAEEPEDFDLRITQKKVALSHCTYASQILVGTVIVASTSGPQKVTIRYTTDEWASYQDVTANYLGRENESADQFVFDIEMKKKSTLHFAICCNINGSEYWDNNNRNNYSLVAE